MSELVKLPPTLEALQRQRAALLQLAAQHGASKLRVFGSVARGDADANSDIDFLVDFQPGTSIWDMVGLWQDLSALLGCEVSVVPESTLEGSFRQHALKDAMPL